MGTQEEQRRSSWASRLAGGQLEHLEAHREHRHGRMRPLRRDAQEHHQRILEAARRLFAEQGVEAVSMRQIALAADVGQGTLYRRYANKGALCMDLLQDHQEQFMAEMSAMLVAQGQAPALDRLDRVLEMMVGLLEEKGGLLESIAAAHLLDPSCYEDERAPTSPDGPHSMRDAPWYQLPHAVLVGLLREAVARDELSPLDEEYTADVMQGVLNPMFYRLQRQELGYSPERILHGLRHIFVEGIQHP